MKAIKKGYRKGGKMYQEGGNTGGPGDPPKTPTPKELHQQINTLKKERDRILSEQTIFGQTKFADKYPELKGLVSFGVDGKVANQVRDYYEDWIDFLNKKIKEQELKPYSRPDFLESIGADRDA